jgi:RNA polymerase sigma-70 factor (ECF subfamily)
MAYHRQSTEEALRQGCIEQHRLAQQYLYERYFGRLLGVAMRYADDRDTAIGVLNQAFLKIFNNMGQYQNTGSFFGWMTKIVLHTAIDHVRSQNAYRQIMDFSTPADDRAAADATGHLEAEDIFRLVQKLPPASRTVFSLYVVDGYKHREIADLLGIDEGTSKWHLSNARRELQKMLRPEYQPNQ